MSHGGIYNLVTGKVLPYGKTLAKLRAWYLQQWAAGGEGLSTPAAHYLIEQMLGSLPRGVRARAGVELLDAMEGPVDDAAVVAGVVHVAGLVRHGNRVGKPAHQLGAVLVGAQHLQRGRVQRGGHGAAAVEQLEQPRRLVGGGHAQAVLHRAVHGDGGGAQEGLGVDAGVVQPQRVHLVPHRLHVQVVEQDVRGRVVGEGDHQPGRVAHGGLDAALHVLQHPRAAHAVARQQGDALVQADAPLVHLVHQGDEDGHLDQRGGGKGLVAADGKALAAPQVDHAHPRDARVAAHGLLQRAAQPGGVGGCGAGDGAGDGAARARQRQREGKCRGEDAHGSAGDGDGWARRGGQIAERPRKIARISRGLRGWSRRRCVSAGGRARSRARRRRWRCRRRPAGGGRRTRRAPGGWRGGSAPPPRCGASRCWRG